MPFHKKQDKVKDDSFDKSYGEVFQRLRKSKNIIQENAAEGVVSVTHLSNFETGNSSMAVDKLFALLKNINVNLYEYDDARNHYLQNQGALLYEVNLAEALVNKDINKLEALLGDIRQNPERGKHALETCHIEAVIAMLDPSQEMSEADVHLIADYLLALGEWSLRDILLFRHSLTVFDGALIDRLADRLILGSEDTINLPTVKRAFVQTLLDILNTFLKQEAYAYAKKTINHLKHMKITEYYMYEHLMLKYEEAKYGYLHGRTSALATMQRCREIFEYCECPSTAKRLGEEIAALVKA